MRVVNFILAAMFLLFAFFQINDPDPVIWIMIYGTMAVFSIMAIFQFYPQRFLLAAFILFLAYSFVYFKGVQEWLRQEDKLALFSNVAKMEHLYIEEAREFLGLMICLAVLAYYYYCSRKLAKS